LSVIAYFPYVGYNLYIGPERRKKSTWLCGYNVSTF